MNAKEWAERLNGREYRDEMNGFEEKQAHDDGVIIVFGASDDLIEFRGVINDEGYAWDGVTVSLTNKPSLFKEDENQETLEFNRMQIANMNKVQAIWCPTGQDGRVWASWHIVLHGSLQGHPFDIMEDGELFCRGIVFDSKQLTQEAL